MARNYKTRIRKKQRTERQQSDAEGGLGTEQFHWQKWDKGAENWEKLGKNVVTIGLKFL